MDFASSKHVVALSGPGQIPGLLCACEKLGIDRSNAQLYFAYKSSEAVGIAQGTLDLGRALGFEIINDLSEAPADPVLWTHRGGLAPDYIASFSEHFPDRSAVIELYDGQRSNFVIRQEATLVSRGEPLPGADFAADVFVAPAFAQWSKFAHPSALERTIIVDNDVWRHALTAIDQTSERRTSTAVPRPDAVLALGKFAELGYPLADEIDFYRLAIDHMLAEGASCVLVKPHPRTTAPGKIEALAEFASKEVVIGDALALVELVGLSQPSGYFLGLAGTAQLSMRDLFGWRTAHFGKPLIQDHIDSEFGVSTMVPFNADFWVMNELGVDSIDRF